MNDREFLMWLHQRLVNVHGEKPLYDYMHKLRAVIAATPAGQTSRNGVCNDIDDLKAMLAKPAPKRWWRFW